MQSLVASLGCLFVCYILFDWLLGWLNTSKFSFLYPSIALNLFLSIFSVCLHDSSDQNWEDLGIFLVECIFPIHCEFRKVYSVPNKRIITFEFWIEVENVAWLVCMCGYMHVGTTTNEIKEENVFGFVKCKTHVFHKNKYAFRHYLRANFIFFSARHAFGAGTATANHKTF